MRKIISSPKAGSKNLNQVIDGFIKPTSSNNFALRGANQLHKRADKAQTLMRTALAKPVVLPSQIQRAVPGYNPSREAQAKKIPKHNQVERFGHPTAPVKTVYAKPTHRFQPLAKASANTTKPSAKNQVVLPSMVASASHQKLERMLDVALTQADAHKKALKYQAARHFWQKPGFLGRKRRLKVGIFISLFLGATLFAAWHKIPLLSVKFAAAKAHISASLPGYKPTGYSLAEPAHVKDGSVVLNYKTPHDTDGFELAQKVTNMTSSNVQKTVIPAGTQVQTSQVSGNTVYIYGPNNDAAWVNNGVLYTIKDHSKLSSDQIIKIVQGMAD